MYFMYKNLKLYLVIPVYNEEKLIIPTLKGVPKTIDKIMVVNDASTDKTARLVLGYSKKDRRVKLVNHEKNAGVGQSIVTGYKKCAEEKADVVVVVGGDNQMDLADLPNFLEPFVKDEADYVKGNRFLWRSLKDMPKHRFFGNSLLSLMTKIASGYWKIFDTQDGYTAISRRVIETVDWNRAWKGYGYVSDWLIKFNAYGFRVKDVPRRPIYLKGEKQSQIRIGRYAVKIMPLLLRGFFWRLKEKYIVRDFHPLVFFYIFGLMLLPLGLISGLWLLYHRIFIGNISSTTAILSALFIISGLQLVLFAMLFDMEASD
jgi:glycosyltransferase involved in cell wall biosynthesis